MSGRVLRAFLLGGVFWLVGMTFLGCGNPAKPRDGRLYFVNNTRPSVGGEEWIKAVFDEIETDIEFNMTYEGELIIGVGAVPISDELLAGGTEVTVECRFRQQGDTFSIYKTLIIDGNMTVGAYETNWNTSQGMLTLRVHKGIFNGPDPAAGS